MKWHRVAVVLVFVLFVSFVGVRAPVARAATYTVTMLPLCYIHDLQTGSNQRFELGGGDALHKLNGQVIGYGTSAWLLDGVPTTGKWLVCDKTGGGLWGGIGLPAPTAAVRAAGATHTISWGNISFTDAYGQTWVTSGGSYTWKYATVQTGDVWLTPEQYAAYGPLPLSVVVTGASSVGVNSSSSYTATISGGVAPFTGRWTATGLVNSLGPLAAVSGTTSVLAWAFGSVIGQQTFRYDVTDSTGATASGAITVNVGAFSPDFKGQLFMINGQVCFLMYPTASNPVGQYVDPGNDAVVNTKNYVIDTSTTGVMWSYYITSYLPPLANPFVVHATYTDPTDGRQYQFTFSFDTSSLANNGDWVQGDGSKGSGELPSWLNALINMFKEGMKWLFVPSDSQMLALVPSSSIGADLGLGGTWGVAATSWTLSVPINETLSVHLLTIDFVAAKGYLFVKALRYAVQAVMSVSLVYLVVVLL